MTADIGGTVKVAEGLAALADHVDGMRWKAVWPSLHVVAHPVDDGYSHRVGLVFTAVQRAANVKYVGYLSGVLKTAHARGELGQIMKEAASQLSRSAG